MLMFRAPGGRISTIRVWAVAAVVGILALLALLQFTPWAPLPNEHDSTMAGVAAGAAFMGLIVYFYAHARRER